MIELIAAADDDCEFVELVSRLIAGVAAVHGPSDLLIYKIDHWFDHKWLGFSGKTLGLIGEWRRPLTIPPFVPNRIIRGWRYQRDEVGDDYREIGSPPDVHHQGWSALNLHRRVERIVPDSALFWLSGDTATSDRGSLMAYVPVDGEHWTWFLAFVRKGEWKIDRQKDIHAYEVRLFEEAAGKARQGKSGV